MVEIIPGKRIARELSQKIAFDVARLVAERGVTPTLAVILMGDDPASKIYVNRKIQESKTAGIRSMEYRLPSDTNEETVLEIVDRLNRDPAVHGILVQSPFPAHIEPTKVLEAVHPSKDVDGFNPINVGRLSIGAQGMRPCTPLGCMILLETVINSFRGKFAVVIGRSNIVGRPMSYMLLERECTIVVTHLASQNLPSIVRMADIVVAAAGSPELVRGDWIKPGAVVIDVGITRRTNAEGKVHLVGDVAFHEMEHALAVTPVPGGVGPMTLACLLRNTVAAAWSLSDA